MSDRFQEFVDGPDLAPEERERLRRVHDLLVAAGSAPDAPGLEPPLPANVLPFGRRRARPLLLLAAALGLALAGGAGYVLGREEGEEAAPATTATVTAQPPATTAPPPPETTPPPPGSQVVAMTGVGEASDAWATVELLPRDPFGDYPVRLTVGGLRADGTYEMWVVDDDGEFDQLCGSFRVSDGAAETVLTVPYEMRTRDDWVIVPAGTTQPVLET